MKLRPTAMFGIPIFIIGLLYTPIEQAAKLTSHKRVREDTSTVTFRGGSGVGVFKDIQVPVNEYAQHRGDGSEPKEEFLDHVGFPLFVGLDVSDDFGNWRTKYGFDLMSITSSGGESQIQTSSYSRVNLGSGLDYIYGAGAYKTHIGTRLNLRRSSFENLSNGHHINAAYTGISAGILKEGSFSVEAFAAAAPVSEFRFHSGNSVNGNKFESATSKVAEFGLLTSFNIYRNAWFDLGAEQERAVVTIDDVSEYDGFGLGVTPTLQPNRVYDFATTVLRVGFHKNF